MASGCVPSISASAVSTRRCASTGTASALTSSGERIGTGMHQRPGASRAQQCKRSARGRPEKKPPVAAGETDQTHHVVEHFVLGVNGEHLLLKRAKSIRAAEWRADEAPLPESDAVWLAPC